MKLKHAIIQWKLDPGETVHSHDLYVGEYKGKLSSDYERFAGGCCEGLEALSEVETKLYALAIAMEIALGGEWCKYNMDEVHDKMWKIDEFRAALTHHRIWDRSGSTELRVAS